jgi:DNA replication licensing factor MCM6
MKRGSVCCQVHAKHVKEAYRLLNKSIIRVEQPDIHLDEEEEQLADEPMDLDENNRDALHAEPGVVNGVYIPLSHIMSQL